MKFKSFLIKLSEEFADIGKLSPDQLKKGLPLKSSEDFIKVTGRVYHQAINRIRNNDIAKLNKNLPSKGLNSLHIYEVKDYMKMNCFLGKNNSSGYCLKPDGELVSVFSSQGSSGKLLMKSAVKNGAKYLDCFALRDPKTGKIDGPLFRLYSKFGFKINKSMNSGTPGEPYAIINGVSDFVDDYGEVQPSNPQVVVFMKR